MARKRRGFTAAEFDRAVGAVGLEPQNVAIARAVLVDGRPQAAIARDAGVNRQRVGQIVAKMEKAILRVPEGWRTDTATLPRSDWRKVRALERSARAALRKKKIP